VLWRLQGQTRVRAFHPDGIDPAGALAAINQGLRAESRRHAGWLGFDTICLLLSLLLIPLPGPNLIGYYFAFRVVGHVLSIRGARQGLTRVTWDLEASRPLGEPACRASTAPASCARWRTSSVCRAFRRFASGCSATPPEAPRAVRRRPMP
jgi:hypothetical protein